MKSDLYRTTAMAALRASTAPVTSASVRQDLEYSELEVTAADLAVVMVAVVVTLEVELTVSEVMVGDLTTENNGPNTWK